MIYNYNNTFKVTVYKERVYGLETTANNGITTPSGVTVGMSASVLDKYGDVYYDKTEHGVREKAFWAMGRVVLILGIANNKIISIRTSL